jgi:hypothetical protein
MARLGDSADRPLHVTGSVSTTPPVGAATEATLSEISARIGDDVASPAANTLQDRLKTLAGHVDGVEGSLDARNNAFATLLNLQPLTTAGLVKRDPGPAVGAGFQYHGRNANRAALDSTTDWEVVRLELDASQELIEAQYKSGIAWSDRTNAGHWA